MDFATDNIELNENDVYLLTDLLRTINENIENISFSINKIDLSNTELPSKTLFAGDKTKIEDLKNSLHDLYDKANKIKTAFQEIDSNTDEHSSELGNQDNLDEDFAWLNDNANPIRIRMGMIYNQYNYGHISYGPENLIEPEKTPTLASDGCGFFSVLSAITVKNGHEFEEEEIEHYAGIIAAESGLSNAEKMEMLLDVLGKEYNFTWHKGSKDNIRDALINDNAVIALSNDSRHFVPLTGVFLDSERREKVVINESDGFTVKGNLVYEEMVEKNGFEVFDIKNRDITLSFSCVDQDGDGEKDDVWFLDFYQGSSASPHNLSTDGNDSFAVNFGNVNNINSNGNVIIPSDSLSYNQSDFFAQ